MEVKIVSLVGGPNIWMSFTELLTTPNVITNECSLRAGKSFMCVSKNIHLYIHQIGLLLHICRDCA